MWQAVVDKIHITAINGVVIAKSFQCRFAKGWVNIKPRICLMACLNYFIK